jgi:hydrogenase maturation protein HypF
MAEHGIRERILAIVADGTGYGADHTAWGGELLAARLTDYYRLACLRPLSLPGGDAAAHDTNRAAMAMLFNAYGPGFGSLPVATALFPDPAKRDTLSRMIRNDVHCVASSSIGRVFDGMAAILGLADRNEFEGQAPMAVEAAASKCDSPQAPAEPLYELIGTPRQLELDLSPLVRHIVQRRAEGGAVTELAALFHDQLAAGLDAVTVQVVDRTEIRCVGLTGGVFCNERLTRRLTERLRARGLHVIRHRIVPPNDGGLALGQAAVAAARQAAGLDGKDGG